MAARPDPRGFLLAFAACVGFGLAAIVAAHLALDRAGLLPPPPLVATPCIDEKLDSLAHTPLGDVQLVAVGSSATWRNLDMREVAAITGQRALNAAPCYLQIHQTGRLAELLLPRMPALRTLLVLLHPRDFDACRVDDRDFFDPSLAEARLDGEAPRWLVYAMGFRPTYLWRQAWGRHRGSLEAEPPSAFDGAGSAAMTVRGSYWPRLRIDPACYGALQRLDARTHDAGVRLAVVLLPAHPGWVRQVDPSGQRLDAWARAVDDAVVHGLTVDDRNLGWPAQRFADPVHLLHPYERAFSRLVAQQVVEGAGGSAIVGLRQP